MIAVCLARYFLQATVTATDVSEQALELAKANAALNGVEDRVSFVRSDWFEELSGRFDLIVSNPPYVDGATLDDLPPTVRDHEPKLALDGGRGGLEKLAALVGELSGYLKPGGLVFLEVGDGQAASVTKMLENAGSADVRTESDLAGKPRYLIVRWPS